MAEFTFQTEIYATSQAIWEMYTNLNKRRQWETDLEYILLNGDFATGTSGTMKLQNQPEMPYTLTSVIPQREYWDRTEIPDAGIAICFGHEFTDMGDGTLVKISANLEKSTAITEEEILFLAQVFSDTPQAVLTIKKMVENKND
ncbi:hypothetical protein [Pelosinus sp. UFO1]|uniref:hypothetical protein n=1 Tax=Pelosinus sp. UFO1 TaxID=484770 RepID=UPI0004D0D3B9|nr:hypothetical protein [Pelosinus sp. UFO1]AIF53070.1 hypothetical protein UFO1_3527 [Pelosinus sp. UFO1]